MALHRRTVLGLATAVGLAACLAACSPREDAPVSLVVEMLPSPTGPGAAEPSLHTSADGRVILSWLEPAADKAHALRVAIRETDGKWSAPREILNRSDLFVNWADFPSVVSLGKDRLLAHWLQRNGDNPYSYEVRLAESRDDGASWSESVTPHAAGIEAEHGFATILPDGRSGAYLFFLDGGANRTNTADPEYEFGGSMSLSTNVWRDGTDASAKTVLDSRTCDCCQTGAAMTSRGPVMVYRDRSDAEIRDIAIRRLVDGAWTAPARVFADDWEFEACPVNGPGIAADGDQVAVAWFTGAQDTPRVQVAFSTDAGATFGSPVRVDDGSPAGRVGIAWWDGAAVVSWLEYGAGGEGDDGAVRLRRIRPDGRADAAVTVSQTDSARSSGFPRLTRTKDGLLLAWTAPGTPDAVRVATVRAAKR